jgi:hypothetical protein
MVAKDVFLIAFGGHETTNLRRGEDELHNTVAHADTQMFIYSKPNPTL